MKVALVHYHLRTGGVTKVISNQSAALTKLGVEHLVLSAGPAPENIPHALIPELDYLSEEPSDSVSLYQTILAACLKHWGLAPDLWHIHNPTLGKNILFPQLVRDIAESQIPLVLQPHDFAEDNRPSNYPLLKGDHIYPLAPQIHYAFINSRDQGFFESAGLPPSQSQFLPNAVATKENTSIGPEQKSDGKLILYPVRGIRRKNLGEIVLLSVLAPPQTNFAVSLAPENQQWETVHQRWSEFAAQHQLPVRFDVTNKQPPAEHAESTYESWLTHSTHLITTSIAEGFGLAFLEPVLHQRPLLGRDLPEITEDFRSQGIQPGRLYQEIPIPLSALDVVALREELGMRLNDAYQQYGVPLTNEMKEAAWQSLIEGNQVDFGNLPEPFQEDLITRFLNGQADFLLPLKEWLTDTLQEDRPTATEEQLASYSLEQSQVELMTLYQRALDSKASPPTWIPKANILSQFLSPARFHFLRS